MEIKFVHRGDRFQRPLTPTERTEPRMFTGIWFVDGSHASAWHDVDPADEDDGRALRAEMDPPMSLLDALQRSRVVRRAGWHHWIWFLPETQLFAASPAFVCDQTILGHADLRLEDLHATDWVYLPDYAYPWVLGREAHPAEVGR